MYTPGILPLLRVWGGERAKNRFGLYLVYSIHGFHLGESTKLNTRESATSSPTYQVPSCTLNHITNALLYGNRRIWLSNSDRASPSRPEGGSTARLLHCCCPNQRRRLFPIFFAATLTCPPPPPPATLTTTLTGGASMSVCPPVRPSVHSITPPQPPPPPPGHH